MRVLVMGGTGLLGAGIVRRLVLHGHDIVATSRGKRAIRSELPASVRVEQVDRHDLAAMRALVDRVRPEAVVDGIAYTGQDGRDDLSLFSGRAGHLVMISTDFTYRPSWQRLPITEDAPLRAGTSYSEGKVDCEEVFRGQTTLPATIFRPPHIMGPGGLLGSGTMQNRDAMLLDRMRRGVPIVLIDGGTLVLQPVHVDDAGDAVAAVLGRESCFGKPYNLTSATAAPTREYYEFVAREIGVPLRALSLSGDAWLRAVPDGASYVRHRMYDLSRLRVDAGWSPKVAFDEAISRTVRDVREYGLDHPYVENPAERAVIDALERSERELGTALAAWVEARRAR